MTLRIGLDLDGVAYDFVSAHRDYLTAEFDHDAAVLEVLPDPTSWNVWDHWPISRETWQRTFDDGIRAGHIFGGGHTYAYLGAVEAVQGLAWIGHDIHIVTHRPAAAYALTAQWLDEVRLPHSSLTFSADKTTVPVDVMIEDNVDNCLAVIAAGGRAILVDRPWNQTWKVDGELVEVDGRAGLTRCLDWQHVIDTVRVLAAERAEVAVDEGVVDSYARSGAFDVVGTCVGGFLPPRGDEVSLVVDYGPIGDPVTTPTGEVRITADTGGEKGTKPQQVHQIPSGFLLGLGEVYAAGVAKYPDVAPGRPNWSQGYPWSLSYSAMHRHLAAFWSGEYHDPDDGLPHLLHAAWHCATLHTWHEEGIAPECDDRPAYLREVVA